MADVQPISVGASAKVVKTITAEEIKNFAELSGDFNPLHVTSEYASNTRFQKPVAHGMLLASYASSLVGMHLPGPGALWAQQQFRWPAAVFAGDTIELTLTVKGVSAGSQSCIVELKAVNQNGHTVMEGEGQVILLAANERKTVRRLCERAALVTGGSRGVGAAIANALAVGGACVGITYHADGDAAARVCNQIQERGGTAASVQVDTSDFASVQDALHSIEDSFGRTVDVLVNNAALPPIPRPFLELAWTEIERSLDTHVRSAVVCCQAVLPGMLRQRSGRIVNLGAAFTRTVPPPQWTAFVMAKAALISLTRSLAAEFGPQGITVNVVSPGITETESMAAIPDRLRKVQAMQTPLRRLARPEDIAGTVAFLCSEAADHITGIEIPVCGGATV